MPKFYKDHARGYDLDPELPFIEIDGEKCCVGSADSIIMVCATCAEEHFRENVSQYESCFQGHGRMYPKKFKDRERLDAIWIARTGGSLTTVEERRAERLKRESEKPWNWIFGDKTEADFPSGYVKTSN